MSPDSPQTVRTDAVQAPAAWPGPRRPPHLHADIGPVGERGAGTGNVGISFQIDSWFTLFLCESQYVTVSRATRRGGSNARKSHSEL